MPLSREIQQLAEQFHGCQPIISALGDETRQYLLLEMLRTEAYNGIRVSELTRRTHLSRPAVSHHLQILKKAGIINMRKEGTRNYYYFDARDSLNMLHTLLIQADVLMHQAESQYTFKTGEDEL